MSVRVMALVWERFPSGGTELLAMLALADWASDQGGNCHPSMAAIARKLRVTRSSAQRTIHRLINASWLHVTGGHAGGAPGTTRHYRINLEQLMATGSTDATPTGRTHATGSKSATGSADAADGPHGCTKTGSAGATQTINEPSRTVRERRSRAQSPKGTRFALDSLPDDWRAFARTERQDIDADREFQIFVDYWRAQPGQKGVKVDWAATWRNWIRRANPPRTTAAASGHPVDNVRTLPLGKYT